MRTRLAYYRRYWRVFLGVPLMLGEFIYSLWLIYIFAVLARTSSDGVERIFIAILLAVFLLLTLILLAVCVGLVKTVVESIKQARRGDTKGDVHE